MDKDSANNLFVNDGSFMEKFKQLQQEKQEESPRDLPKSNTSSGSSGPLRINTTNFVIKKPLDVKISDTKKSSASTSGGKLAFSLKNKSKVALPPVKLGADEDEVEGDAENGLNEVSNKRLKLNQADAFSASSGHGDVVPSPPNDPAVRNVADKLASFVAKNGRQIEHVTRQRNPGNTPFKFLFDPECSDYKYYEYQVQKEEKLLAQQKESRTPLAGTSSPVNARTSTKNQRNSHSHSHNSNYQTPASALYEANESSSGEASGAGARDPIAMMEFYMKKAAHEERRRQPKQSKDEMPPPASLQASTKKGHHMGDFIPPEVLEKFLASCDDVSAQKATMEAAEKAKIQADNVGHKLLSKMGWREVGTLNNGVVHQAPNRLG